MLVVISLFIAINIASIAIDYFISKPKIVVKRDGSYLYKSIFELRKIR